MENKQDGPGRLNPFRETKFSGVTRDREILFFVVQLTTSRIDKLTPLIHTLLYVVTIHIYIYNLGRNIAIIEALFRGSATN